MIPAAVTHRHSIRLGEDSVRLKGLWLLARSALRESPEPAARR